MNNNPLDEAYALAELGQSDVVIKARTGLVRQPDGTFSAAPAAPYTPNETDWGTGLLGRGFAKVANALGVEGGPGSLTDPARANVDVGDAAKNSLNLLNPYYWQDMGGALWNDFDATMDGRPSELSGINLMSGAAGLGGLAGMGSRAMAGRAQPPRGNQTSGRPTDVLDPEIVPRAPSRITSMEQARQSPFYPKSWEGTHSPADIINFVNMETLRDPWERAVNDIRYQGGNGSLMERWQAEAEVMKTRPELGLGYQSAHKHFLDQRAAETGVPRAPWSDAWNDFDKPPGSPPRSDRDMMRDIVAPSIAFPDGSTGVQHMQRYEPPALPPRKGGTPELKAHEGPQEPNALFSNSDRAAIPGVGFTAYHGSPYDFDRFDASKLGSGEGVQAFGKGLYFAGDEKVAGVYRSSLAEGKTTVDGVEVSPWADTYLKSRGGDLERSISDMTAFVTEREARYNEDLPYDRGQLAELEVYRGKNIKTPGHSYEVNIKADPETFVDLDMPIDQQPPFVRDLANPTQYRAWTKDGRNVPIKKGEYVGTKEEAEAALPRSWLGFGKPKGTVKPDTDITGQGSTKDLLIGKEDKLRAAGVPGFKYYDGMSRREGKGNRNYVVFDDSLIDITRKYANHPRAALPGLSLSGAPDEELLQILEKYRGTRP